MAWTEDQRRAIEEDGTNIIVSAGAGSGKTAVLSERVITKLSKGIHINELLILTFTRAAAEEMKDRIRDNIKKKPELRGELDAIDSSYITTFDSFALSVVKKYHYLADVKKNIAISDDTIVSLEKSAIIDRIFDEHYKKDDVRFANLLKRFTLKNDKPIKDALSELIVKIDNYIDRDEYLDFIKERFFTDEYIASLLDDFESLIDEKKKTLALELQSAYYYLDDDYKDKMDALLLPVINSKGLEELIPYKSIRLPNVPRGSSDETKAAKEHVKAALTELLSLTTFGTLEDIKEDILSTSDTILALVELLEEYYEQLAIFKKKNDIYTFTDIALLAIDILSRHEEAREELKTKFKEIMIDEYQDTNDIQETFISLISRDNVYMVGDIKQSIYRFRGSNPQIFKDKYDRYSKGSGGKKIDLIKNFRSRKEVLENINFIFDLLMNDELGGAEYTESHEMVYGNTSYDEQRVQDYDYNCEILEYVPDPNSQFSNTEIEIFAIAKDIRDKMESGFEVFDKKTGKQRPFRYSDAVIILDRSLYFDQFKSIFEYLKIPLAILKDEKLTASIETYLLRNILDFIIRIVDKDFKVEFKYDFLSIGRSFLYEYSDEELFDTITESTYWNTKLYKDFSQIEDLNSLSIEELIEVILDKTHFYDKIYKIGDYKNVELRVSKLCELAKSLSTMGYTIRDYRDYLSNIIDNGLEIKYTSYVGDVDSVKILTIHKSKGLEYAVCYFADLDHKFNTKELNEKFISDHRYGIITPIAEDGETDNDSVLKILYKDRFMKEEIGEKIRLFYVALTRAREKFLIVIPKIETQKLETDHRGTIETTRRLKFKGLKDFVYGIRDHLPAYFVSLDTTTLGLSKNYLYDKPIDKKIDFEASNLVVTELNLPEERVEKKRFSKDLPELLTKSDLEKMSFGTLVHEILEFTDFKNYDESLIEDKFIKNKVDAFVRSDLMKDIKNAKVYHEYEFVYEKGEELYHGSIDLMLEYADHIDIVDYKLKNTTDVHYLDQLNGYKNYIEKVSCKPVKTYLYSIIDEIVVPLD